MQQKKQYKVHFGALGLIPINPLNTNKITLNDTKRFSSYRAVNRLHMGYKNRWVNVA
jgi:hypothetical protein